MGADRAVEVGRGGCNRKGSGESPHSIWILLCENCEASRSYGDGERAIDSWVERNEKFDGDFC